MGQSLRKEIEEHQDVKFIASFDANACKYLESWVTKYDFNPSLRDARNKEEVKKSLVEKRAKKIKKGKNVEKLEAQLRAVEVWIKQCKVRAESILESEKRKKEKTERRVYQMKIRPTEETGARRKDTGNAPAEVPQPNEPADVNQQRGPPTPSTSSPNSTCTSFGDEAFSPIGSRTRSNTTPTADVLTATTKLYPTLTGGRRNREFSATLHIDKAGELGADGQPAGWRHALTGHIKNVSLFFKSANTIASFKILNEL